MIKLYTLDCRDLGVDCDFTMQGATIEEIIELCADHGRVTHEMLAFGPDLFIRIRSCIRLVEQRDSDASP
jgi:predicted small metal-binding protein